MQEHHVPVLIAGGSLVGLTTSLLLSHRGVDNLVVERHAGTAIYPRAASFHQNTMEIFRGVGLQRAVEEAAEREFVQHGAIVSVESLAGEKIKYFYQSYSEGVEDLSATSRLFVTQIGLEPVIRAEAASRGAQHRFATELVRFEQDADEVRAIIRPRDGGPEELVHAQYLVGADGAHSLIREQLGIPVHGRGTFANCITIYFRADVRPMLRERNLSVVYVNHPTLLGFFRFSINADAGFLAVFVTSDADGSNRNTDISSDMSEARCTQYIHTALGCGPEVEVEIDSIQAWNASAGWAARFREGRVLLAGDSAHVVPPTGGFGGNTGIADAHNLAWKLALVLDGSAGPGLLDSYDAERRPAAALISEQGYTRYVLRVDPTLPQDDLAEQLDDPSIELGIVYHSAAVDAPPEADDAPVVENPRTPRGRLGTRLPHLPVTRGGEPISLRDLADSGFVLLTGPAGESWSHAARRASATLGVELPVLRVGAGGEVVADADAVAAALGIAPGGAVLVRPDGVLAWSAQAPGPDPAQRLRGALTRILAR